MAVEHHLEEALRTFRQRLAAAEYALYRVRRIYQAPGVAHRAVEKLQVGSYAEMAAQFTRLSNEWAVSSEHGLHYGYLRERVSGSYPTAEEFFVVAPAVVESKTRHGFAWFEARWRAALGESLQESLFA